MFLMQAFGKEHHRSSQNWEIWGHLQVRRIPLACGTKVLAFQAHESDAFIHERMVL